MYKTLINQNPLINKYNDYRSRDSGQLPFQQNTLINNNVHVRRDLDNIVNLRRNSKAETNIFKQKLNNNTQIPSKNIGRNNGNLIEALLKPQVIEKDNSDMKGRFETAKKVIDETFRGDNHDEMKKAMTNIPYKLIMDKHRITKDVNYVATEDFIAHKTVKEIDANIDDFNKDLKIKEKEKKDINDELEIEFHIDNYSRHKKNFEHNESYIRNVAYKEKDFDESRQDSLDFYKKLQQKAEAGRKLCDEILMSMDESIVHRDEIPTMNRSEGSTESVKTKAPAKKSGKKKVKK